jgi:hypothetical protein
MAAKSSLVILFALVIHTASTVSRSIFPNDYFVSNASKLFRFRYDDFYDNHGNQLTAEHVNENLGINLRMLKLFQIRRACSGQERPDS